MASEEWSGELKLCSEGWSGEIKSCSVQCGE